MMRIMLDGIHDTIAFAIETGVILSICMLLLAIIFGMPFLALSGVFKLVCIIGKMQFKWLYPACAYILAWCLILTKWGKTE